MKGLDDAGRGLRADGRRPAAVAAPGGRRAGPDPLRRPRRRAGAAPPGARARARPGTARWSPIVGEPGVGKSRLVWEFTHSHRTHGWLVLEAGSVSYGKATPYLPVIELLKALLPDRGPRRPAGGPREGHRQAPDARPGAGARAAARSWRSWTCRSRTRRGRRSTRRSAASARWTRSSACCSARARSSRSWWSSRTSTGSTRETQALLDSLVESLPDRAAPAPRQLPARVPARAGAARPTTRQLRLDPLPPESAEELLDALLGTDAGLEPLKRLLIERTEGNPFFLEESVRTLVETGCCRASAGAYRLAEAAGRRPGPARCRPCWPRASTGCRPRTSGSSRRPRSSARTCPFALLQADRRAARGRRSAGPRPPPGRRVPLRDEPVPRSRVHVQARADPRGRLRQPAPGAAARAARADRGGDRAALPRPPRRARRAARPPRVPGRAVGEGGRPTSARPAPRRWRARPTGRRWPTSSRRWPRSGTCPRAASALEQAIDLRLELRGALCRSASSTRTRASARGRAARRALGDRRRLGGSAPIIARTLWMPGDHDRALELGQRALALAASSVTAPRGRRRLIWARIYYGWATTTGRSTCSAEERRRLEGDADVERFGTPASRRSLSRTGWPGAWPSSGQFPEAAGHGRGGTSDRRSR